MYTQNTKTRVAAYIQEMKEITWNKLQYVGQEKKQVHSKNLLPIIQDLEKEGIIDVIEHVMNNKKYRVIKWK